MKTISRISALIAFVTLGACGGEVAPPAEMTNADRGQIQAEVLSWADQWLDAASNLDAHGLSALFDQADGHFMRGTEYESNIQAFVAGSEELYGSWDAWEPVWGTKRIDVLAPDAALFVGEASGLLRFPDGREVDNRAVLSFVLRKKDGVWKGLFGQVTASTTPRD